MGATVYRTLSHRAVCRDCPWSGKPLDATTPSRLVRIRNSNANNHAKRNRHRVVVEIVREFDCKTEHRNG